nr:hypothetical protein B0A51_10964 [Rachicladosporium sp. CCFEE 5018]
MNSSVKYGLTVASKKAAPVRKTILDDEDENEFEDIKAQDEYVEELDTFSLKNAPSRKPANVPPRGKPTAAPPKRTLKKLDDDIDETARQDASTMAANKARIKKAEAVDAAIFDYDAFHDAKASVVEAKKEAAKQDAIDRKPKYINNLLDAAARRKQDQQIAKEKLLQRERENEGDEFADKEKFVTGAYKLQQEETRTLEEEEKRKGEAEETRKRKMGGGMQGFHRNLLDQTERLRQQEVEAAERVEKEGGVKLSAAAEEKRRTDAEVAAELKAKGVNVHLNEDGQITDKRELLTAGLNVAPAGKTNGGGGSEHLRSDRKAAQSAFQRKDHTSQQAQRERQTKMMEEQLEASLKRKREEDEEQRAKEEREAKSKKTETEVSDAKARYLARKAAKAKESG